MVAQSINGTVLLCRAHGTESCPHKAWGWLPVIFDEMPTQASAAEPCLFLWTGDESSALLRKLYWSTARVHCQLWWRERSICRPRQHHTYHCIYYFVYFTCCHKCSSEKFI